MILLFVIGALSMLAQVVILRELVSALFGVELLYVAALGSWLIGAAAGSIAGRRLPETPAAAVAGCVGLGLLVPGELVFVRAGAAIAGAVPGAYLPFPAQLLLIIAATVPPAAVCGLLFPPLASLAARRRTRLSRGYAAESAGAAAGGALVTLLFWLGASTVHAAMLTAAVALAAAIATGGRRRPAAAAMTVLAVVTAAGLSRARAWDLALSRWLVPSLVAVADTPYARLAIARSDGQVAVFENGALAFDTEGTSAEAFADIAAVQHPRPRRALVIGGGFEGVPAALGDHAIPMIDDLEIDARAYDLIRAHAPVPRRTAEETREPRAIFAEPRRFLQRATPYDLILVATGEPTSGASNRFFTREFFAACARGLAPGGVLAVRLAAAENVWPRPLALRTASIVNAMHDEFADVDVVPGATLYLFASASALTRDPAVLAGRLLDRGVHARLITPPYLRYLYENDRRGEVQRLLQSERAVGSNRDASPICYRYAAMLWLSRFYPGLAAGEWKGGRMSWWLGFAVVIGLVASAAWVRGRPRRRLAGLLFGAGLIGMVLETILLLQYQVANGIVFQQVGWLLTCFMAGLTAGGWILADAGERLTAPAQAALRHAPAAALLVASLGVWASSRVPAMAGLGWTSLMLAATGFVVGACFASAAERWPADRRQAASSLYAADVAGGAAGAVLATLALVPWAGLDGSALLMAALAAALLAI